MLAMTNMSLVLYYTPRYPLVGAADDGECSSDGPARRRSGVVRARNTYNLCLFQCIAMWQESRKDKEAWNKHKQQRNRGRIGKRAIALYTEWCQATGRQPDKRNFPGVDMSDFPSIEMYFRVALQAYELIDGPDGDMLARTTRRSSFTKEWPIVNLDMSPEGDHVDWISDIDAYSNTFLCGKCAMPFGRRFNLRRHEPSCLRSSPYSYKGGPFYPRRDVFAQLEEMGVDVPTSHRFHQYRATFDMEAFLAKPSEGLSTPAGLTSTHVPMSCSVWTNLPGREGRAEFFLSNGSPQALVGRIMSYLWRLSDEAYDLNLTRYRDVLRTLADMEELQKKEAPLDEDRRRWKSPLKRVIRRLHVWMRAMPVVGFNSANYDMNLIKPYIVRTLVQRDEYRLSEDGVESRQRGNSRERSEADEEEPGEEEEGEEDGLVYTLKKGSSIVCLATEKLTFLDISSYLAPGCSYKKYLATFGQSTEGKSFFPYEYVDSLEVLKETELPPYDAFYSSLRNSNTLEEGRGREHGEENYRELQELWRSEGFGCIGDLLRFYNDRDVKPFGEALQRHIDVFREMGLDLLKDAHTLPGLSLKFAMRGLDGTFFTFGPDMGDIYQLIRSSMVGGPSLVFCRFQEAGLTKIKPEVYGEDGAFTCRSIMGYDANALYPYSMAQESPTGQCTVRRWPDFEPRRQSSGPSHSRVSLEWLDYIEHRLDRALFHAGNGPEVKVGGKKVPVDGFDAQEKTVYQFHGCLYHGHECMDETAAKRARMSKFEDLTAVPREVSRERTESVSRYIRETCKLKLVEKWECQWKKDKQEDPEVASFVAMRNEGSKTDHQNWRGPRDDSGATEEEILSAISTGRLFGMALVDIEVPKEERQRFSEFPPIFKGALVGRNDIGPLMKEHCERYGMLKEPRKMLISSFWGREMLVITPLLRWYLEHGLKVTRVHMVLEWTPMSCFSPMMEQVAQIRRDADRDESKTMLGNCGKLLSNSAYGKLCEQKLRFREVKYYSAQRLDRAVNSPRFCSMTKLTGEPGTLPARSAFRNAGIEEEEEEQGTMECEDFPFADSEAPMESETEEDVFEVQLAPRKFVLDLPLHIPFFVYQHAKLKMLEFRYDLMERYMDPRKWCSMYMDTDSLYIATSSPKVRDLLRPERAREFYEHYDEWFPGMACDVHTTEFVEASMAGREWNVDERPCCRERFMFDSRTPGLFKLEFQGDGMVALCSKTYYCKGSPGGQENKFSCKGLQKNSNTVTYEQYKRVLQTGRAEGGENRGIRSAPDGSVYTYKQARKALSYVYGKRKVAADGVTTEPLDL